MQLFREAPKEGVYYAAVIASVAARDSVVGAATRYGLDGMGLSSSGGEIFGTRPDWPGVHPASCTVQWVPGLFPGGLEV